MAAAFGVGEIASYWPEQALGHGVNALTGPALPQFRANAETAPALAERFPWVQYGEATSHKLQIANAFKPGIGFESAPTEGRLGEREFTIGSRAVIPWAPMFERPSVIFRANRELQSLAGVEQLFIKDEGSDLVAIYGNKVRKYEFLLPNLHYSGVRKIYSHGAYGSNHCAHLALTGRFAEFHSGPRSEGMDVVLNLYPQAITENVVTKLRLLSATGVTLNFMQGDAVVGVSIKMLSLMNQTTKRSAEGYIDPGGSSPLSVLGHVEAAMELAQQIESGSCELNRYPDYVFLPIGTGGTAMGLALGFYLLGWPTRVVVTCSQDKSSLAKLVVNGDIGAPFDIAHACHLLEESLPWARKLGLVEDDITPAKILKGRLFYDNETWLPAYGKMNKRVAERAGLANDLGLVLDGTFSAKAFDTLGSFAERGLLKNKRILFWNTYQRFPFETILPQDDAWAKYLPEDVQSRLFT
ncbi:pyridoxal-phosphate dependent enzyme [Methylocapsa palsarum]|uniref:pyridoxal-phosphate dependent enzyme n=1 Tax=Methylocapsa palsarum TaxID=1612308 RepID=UPI000B84A7D7|nr:pyridoxal-phosphate dependent enzyme [Methylocapsa palsarum]